MTNIKMLKDKGRTIIIITGADRERDEAAFKIASTYMLHQPQADASADIGATDCPPPIEEVQGLEAPAEKADDIPNNEQIAQMEGCKHPAIMKSIAIAEKKIKKYFSK